MHYGWKCAPVESRRGVKKFAGAAVVKSPLATCKCCCCLVGSSGHVFGVTVLFMMRRCSRI